MGNSDSRRGPQAARRHGAGREQIAERLPVDAFEPQGDGLGLQRCVNGPVGASLTGPSPPRIGARAASYGCAGLASSSDPSNVPVVRPVAGSKVRWIVNVPETLANRPVPPVIVACSTIVTTGPTCA